MSIFTDQYFSQVNNEDILFMHSCQLQNILMQVLNVGIPNQQLKTSFSLFNSWPIGLYFLLPLHCETWLFFPHHCIILVSPTEVMDRKTHHAPLHVRKNSEAVSVL